jgi:hypothetical protein
MNTNLLRVWFRIAAGGAWMVAVTCSVAEESPARAGQDDAGDLRAMKAESKRLVSRHEVVWTEPPKKVGPWGERLTGRTQPGGDPGTTSVTDGPVLGNGNIGAVISGPPEAQRYWLGKNDFWRLKSHDGSGYTTSFGHLELALPDLKGASYEVRQSLYEAVTRTTLTQGDARVTLRSYVAAGHPFLMVDMEATGATLRGQIRLRPVAMADVFIAPSPQGAAEVATGEEAARCGPCASLRRMSRSPRPWPSPPGCMAGTEARLS